MPATRALHLATSCLDLPLLAPRPPFRPSPSPSPSPTATATRPERRSGLRLVHPVEFEEHDLDGSGYARCTDDISVGGLSAREGFGRLPGSEVWIRLFLPRGGFVPLELRARVIGPYQGSAGVRLRFVALEPGNLAALEDFMRERVNAS